jgi:polysaccharide export outer membrane protein
MRNWDFSLDRLLFSLVLSISTSVGDSWAQQTPPVTSGQQPESSVVQSQQEIGSNAQEPVAKAASNPVAPLLIGPGDQLEITVYGAPDLSTHARVESDGNILLPLVGFVHVTGETSNEAGGKIEDSLRQAGLVKNPRVSVYVKEYTSAGISVAGQVTKPGVYPALGPHRLFDVLQAAGGPTEKAANSVTLSHRDDPEHPITLNFSKDPGQMARNNVELRPGDTVVVPEAGIVYVLGEINKPGGYIMNSSGGVTVLQVVAAAGGPTRLASYSGVKIIRRTPGGLQELPVPLKSLLKAKVADLPVEAGDIVYVPNSKTRSALASATGLMNSAGSAAVYRIP